MRVVEGNNAVLGLSIACHAPLQHLAIFYAIHHIFLRMSPGSVGYPG